MREIEDFLAIVESWRRGEISDDDFRPTRLKFGVYGQRQAGLQMIRVKIPYGGLNAEQLHRLARIAERIANGVAHITTRQDIQYHYVPIEKVRELLYALAEVGLTTREACGNTVRNVTACPLSGIAPTEHFDVTPYALAVANHFLRKDFDQNLPRKFKIALDACPGSGQHIGAAFHDIAALGVVRDGRRGFKLWVGGGLGNTPRHATLLEDFTAEEDLLWTMEAIVRVFNRDGERKNRNRARIKFLLEKLGWEEFVKRVFEMRASIPRPELVLPDVEEKEPVVLTFPQLEPTGPAYVKWKRINVIPQRQAGFSAVYVLVPIGDLTVAQMDAVAKAAALYAEGRIRLTVSQNILLRWVKNENLPALYAKLVEAGLAEGGAERVNDVVSCPGTSTCNLGITHSKGLARALREMIEVKNFPEELSVKISGCPNSCGQHHAADLGFFGTNKRVGERDIPSYQILVGGSAEAGLDYGVPLLRIPARNIPRAFRVLVELYAREREAGERFYDFVRRVGKDRLNDLLHPYETADTNADVDWGRTEAFTAPGKQKGECAG